MSGTRRIGLLRLRRDAVDVWKDWWFFDGSLGTGDRLWMAHNDDFDMPDGAGGSVVVGFEVPAAAPDYESRLFMKGYVGDTGDPNNDGYGFRMVRTVTPTRQAIFLSRAISFNWNGCAVGNYLNDVKTCVGGYRDGATSRFTFLDDFNGTDLGCNSWIGHGNNYHGNTRIVIGAQYRALTTSYNYHYYGRIYFIYWIKGVRIGDSWPKILCDPNDDRVPWEYYDPATYPTMLINFNKPVGATLTPDIQSGPNAPYIFTVEGTPVLNGP